VLALAWVLTAPAARAELNLKWDAPPGCPRGTDVLNRIRALAGSSLEKTENLSAEGRITSAKGRFHLTLLVRDGRDVRKRVIASDSCADLAGAAAISLALLLGIDVSAAAPDAAGPKDSASANGQTTPGTRDEDRSVSPGARSEEPGERNPSSAPNSASGWNFLLRGPLLVADLGPLPNPSVGTGLGIGARYESWRVLLAGYVYRGQTVDAESGEFGAGADLDRMSGQLTLCRGWRSAHFEIAPCLGLALEHLTAQGFGQGVSPESERALWLAPSAGAVGHWYPLKSLAFFAGITGYLELARPRLVIEGLGEVRQLAPGAAGAVIGVEWIL